MSSMYETIMELPLFKGIGKELLSQMLEKTRIEFLKFQPGDILYEGHNKVTGIDFILSGEVKMSYTLNNFKISIEEILGKDRMIGAVNLFGMETKNKAKATAQSEVSVLRIEKAEYIKILQSDHIFILNFVNYLSASAQKGPEQILNIPNPSLMSILETMAFAVVTRAAEYVLLAGEDEEIARFCRVSVREYLDWKEKEEKENNIILDPRGIILRNPRLK